MQKNRQKGGVIVEFALVAGLFVLLMFAIFEAGRLYFLLHQGRNAALEGARTAALCKINDPAIYDTVKTWLPGTTDDRIAVSYLPASCTEASCEQVQVSLNVPYQPALQIFNISSVTVSGLSFREGMQSSAENPLCKSS